MSCVVISALLILALALAIMACGLWDDYRQWNHGTCAKCGKPWTLLSIDETGAEFYMDEEDHCVHIV